MRRSGVSESDRHDQPTRPLARMHGKRLGKRERLAGRSKGQVKKDANLGNAEGAVSR